MPIDSDPNTPDRARETTPAPDGQDSPEAQASSETPGSREPRDGQEAAAFRQEQIAEHVRYQRAADATYQAAARQTWARAVSGLRAAWEQYAEEISGTDPAHSAHPGRRRLGWQRQPQTHPGTERRSRQGVRRTHPRPDHFICREAGTRSIPATGKRTTSHSAKHRPDQGLHGAGR